MATTFGILAMRAAAASAWRRPSSERWRPRARPGSFTPVVGVRPWRTSRTTVGGAGFLSFITPLTLPSPPPEARVSEDPLSPFGGEGNQKNPLLLQGRGNPNAPLSLWRERAGVRVGGSSGRPGGPARCARVWRGAPGGPHP